MICTNSEDFKTINFDKLGRLCNGLKGLGKGTLELDFSEIKKVQKISTEFPSRTVKKRLRRKIDN